MAQDQRGGVGSRAQREVVYFVLFGDSALASLQFTCTGLDFLKLLHPRPSCQKLDSHWTGGDFLDPRAALHCLLA